MALPVRSTSPYTAMLYRKEAIEAESNHRLIESRQASLLDVTVSSSLSSVGSSRSATSRSLESTVQSAPTSHHGEGSKQKKSRHHMTKVARDRRRAEHHNAVVDDLCEIVVDLFLDESKLLKTTQVPPTATPLSSVPTGGAEGPGEDHKRNIFLSSIHRHLSDLPSRYALGVESPSEVLVHMRLMAAARADNTRATVHIANIDEYCAQRGEGERFGRPEPAVITVKLVTISCADCDGLLEHITKLLGTGGAKVLDADVMMTKSDAIVLVSSSLCFSAPFDQGFSTYEFCDGVVKNKDRASERDLSVGCNFNLTVPCCKAYRRLVMHTVFHTGPVCR